MKVIIIMLVCKNKVKDWVAITLAYSFAKSSLDYYMTLPAEEIDVTHWAFRVSNRASSKLYGLITTTKVPKKVQDEVKDYISKVVEPELSKVPKHSPQVLLVLLLNYLISEQDNIQMKMMFNIFNLSLIIDLLYQEDDYKDYIVSHSNLIEEIFK